VTRRTERIAELIREEVSTIILSELHDPRLRFVTITRAEVTTDLAQARVYFSVLGTPGAQRAAMRGLEHAAGHLRRRLGERIRLRRLPALVFRFDEALQKSARLHRILSELGADGQAATTHPAPTPPHGEEEPNEY